ncbi:MAG: DoxX family protein [Paenibacillaceae bacterium]|nr:DoxX family protein [Paenibacillaceae bacterium]
MNIALWIVQGIAALGFVYSGWLKAVQYESAKQSWKWVKDVPRALVAFIGIAELLGALGLIAPQAAAIAPVLTPIAAAGLGAIVLFGAVFHAMRKEYREIGVNAVFLALVLFVLIGRLLTA